MQPGTGKHQSGALAEIERGKSDALPRSPDFETSDFETLYDLACAHMRSGELEQAIQSLRGALKLKFDFPDGWCALGRLQMRLEQFEEALRSFNSALSLQPDSIEALAGRASVLGHLNRAAESLVTLDRLLALTPTDSDAWNNRGSVLVALGRTDDALKSFERAVTIQPDCFEALNNRAVMLCQAERANEALAACDAALALNPDHAVCWNNRGNALIAMARYEEAVASFDRALFIDPKLDPAIQNRDFALFELKRLTRCPPGYLRGLFDEFSPHYDERMIHTLYYRAHTHLRALADRVLPAGSSSLRILDLGSGTGLVGDLFKDLSSGGRLDGVDLSPRMIEAAGRRGIYAQLILGDIETVLQAFERSYDLILAADTMIYFGDLAPTLAGAFKRLRALGFYLFAVERSDGTGWEQTPSRRFRHNEPYLRAAASQAGFVFAQSMSCVLRRQANEPVQGLGIALRKP